MVRYKAIARAALVVITLVAVLAATGARAADKRPLPPSIVQTVDGASIALDQTGAQGQRVYIYLLPESQVSRRLLDALHGWDLPSLTNVSILVGGDAAAAAAFARADHTLTGVQWLLDTDRTAWTDLQVTGVPTLFGIRGGVIEWRLAGVLNDPSALKGVVSTWAAGTAR